MRQDAVPYQKIAQGNRSGRKGKDRGTGQRTVWLGVTKPETEHVNVPGRRHAGAYDLPVVRQPEVVGVEKRHPLALRRLDTSIAGP